MKKRKIIFFLLCFLSVIIISLYQFNKLYLREINKIIYASTLHGETIQVEISVRINKNILSFSDIYNIVDGSIKINGDVFNLEKEKVINPYNAKWYEKWFINDELNKSIMIYVLNDHYLEIEIYGSDIKERYYGPAESIDTALAIQEAIQKNVYKIKNYKGE